MRIEQLRLDRYAQHQERTLNFPPPAGGAPDLHLIIGPNATGKSSTRAAITDLLYGIPNVSPWAIGYEPRLLRLGAIITNRTGESLDFTRLKGRKNVLIGPDGNAIEENVLARFLGVDKALYQALYALGQTTFREGGEEMLKAQSEVGQTIFAAASGLATLSTVQAALTADLDAIGSARKSEQRPVWQAASAYAAALQEAQESALRIEDWKAADRARTEAKEKVDALSHRQVKLEAERDIIECRLRILPVLSDLTRLRDGLKALSDAKPLSVGFEERWRSARENLDRAEVELDRTKTGLEHAQEARRQLPEVAGTLLAFAAEIEFLNTQIGKIRNLVDDEGKLARDVTRAHDRLQELARGLGGKSEDVEALIEKTPSPATMALIRDLITEHEVLAGSVDHNSKTKTLAEQTLKESEGTLKALGNPPNPAEAAALAHATRSIEADARKATKDRATATATKTTEEARLKALTGWNGPAEDLLSAIFPTAAAVTAAKSAIDAARSDEAAAASKLEDIEAETERTEAEIDAAAAGAVPSADAVLAERIIRDRSWSEIRAVALQGQAPAAGAIDTHEVHLRKADHLVDQRLDGADQIAGQRLLAAELKRRRAAETRAEKALEKTRERRKEEEGKAKALWLGSGYAGEIGTADAMLNWLAHKEKAAEAVRARIAAEAEAESSKTILALETATLRQVAGHLGIDLAATLDTQAAIEAAASKTTTALADAQQKWSRAQQVKSEVNKRRSEAETAAADLSAAEQAFEGWKQRWRAELPSINLGTAATPAEAKAILEAWERFGAEAQHLKECERRFIGVKGDLAAHRAEIDALTAKIGTASIAAIGNAPDDAHWQDWPASLYAAFTKAKSVAEAIARADRALQNARDENAKAAGAEAAAQNALKKLRSEAGLGEADDVAKVIEDDAKRCKFAAEIEEKAKSLAEAGDGETEDNLRADLGSATRAETQAALTINSGARMDLQAEINGAIEYSVECRNRLALLDQRAGSNAAQHLALNHAAAVGELTRRWMRVTAAKLLLDATIERYRHEHEAPLIRRANEIFIAVAGNQAPDRFTRLEVDYERPDDPRLIAVRASGSAAKIEELSEGTRDQLWLALRVAALEARAHDGEPMPFLADDLFASFDAARAETGLRHLAELAKSTQVILFTHHDYVVTAARSILSGVNVQELQRTDQAA